MRFSDLDLDIRVIAVSAHVFHFSFQIRRILEVWRVRRSSWDVCRRKNLRSKFVTIK